MSTLRDKQNFAIVTEYLPYSLFFLLPGAIVILAPDNKKKMNNSEWIYLKTFNFVGMDFMTSWTQALYPMSYENGSHITEFICDTSLAAYP